MANKPNLQTLENKSSSRIIFKHVITLINYCVKIYFSFVTHIFSWLIPNWFTWNKYSESMLRTLEKQILQLVKTPHRGFFVDIGPVVGKADKIWTISLNTESSKTPLVLLHGFGAGVALWCLNLDSFAATRPVYAIDLLGFGRSSRPNFSKDSMQAEQQMVLSIEEWRREMNLQNFILLGHSMGGFLAASYSMNYPDKVKHLILADPWGFPEKPVEEIPLWIKTLSYAMKSFNPLAGVRAAGPFGPWVINTIRGDISKKYETILNNPNLIPEYIYQCNCQHPSGEMAFNCMMSDFGWAKNPIVRRIDTLNSNIPVTLLYGSRSWVDHSAAEIIKEKRMHSYFKLQVVTGAGHHLYADRPEAFNQIILDACSSVDSFISINQEYSDEPESDR